jgi:RNA polymerase-associated protein RTF1
MNQYIRGTHTLTFSSHLDSDSDRQPIESEEDMEDPYPLEGKYKDDADKRE